ncbi:SDR family oxidoreductase [Pseudoxanthomonas putridarboris]|uniref:SDR family oxidoreductase n=1 Tax=Pseudoxanthomonas putridarboris TaxID=752605 RepID=A0ABU9IWN3_9GAMM
MRSTISGLLAGNIHDQIHSTDWRQGMRHGTDEKSAGKTPVPRFESPGGRTVLLTGTSSGLGAAAARGFLEDGWKVVATARDAAAVLPGGVSDSLVRCRLDVADAASVGEAFDLAELRFGGVDVVVNNAGVGLGGALEDIPLDRFRAQLEVNLVGVAAVCQEATRRMRRRGAGLIINVSSAAGRVGLPYLSPYCASKFAIEGLTESLHFELKPLGIRVKLFEPGGMKSSFSHPWVAGESYQPAAGQVLHAMEKGLQAAASPEEAARTLLAVARDPSDRLRYTATDAGRLLTLRRLLTERAWRGFVLKAFGVRDGAGRGQR